MSLTMLKPTGFVAQTLSFYDALELKEPQASDMVHLMVCDFHTIEQEHHKQQTDLIMHIY
jgi:hypothetical protein